MATTMRRTTRQATPERWQRALERALAAGVQVRQVGSTGQWIATSASDPTAAYKVAVTNGVAHGCDCKAAEFGDPVCCHRAMWFHLAGLLDPEPPTPAAPAPAMIPAPDCRDCLGEGYRRMQTGGGLPDWWAVPCRCRGRAAPAALAA